MILRAVDQLQCLLRAQLTACKKAEPLRCGVGKGVSKSLQLAPPVFREGKIGASAVQMLLIGPGPAVTDQYKTHYLSSSGSPQNTRHTLSARELTRE